MFKSAFVILACVAAFAAGNPAVGVEWRWTSRQPTVTPNIMGLPFSKVVQAATFTPQVFIPGTKAVEGCGPTAMNRIVGGEEAVPNSFPWQVALFIDDAYFCGGSIISDEWVMTAAHCMDGAQSVEVVAGAHNIREAEPTQVSQFSSDFFVHENWAPAVVRNDIAMIRLPTAFTWTAAIAPVCLPAHSDADLPTGTQITASGWGKISDASFGISDTLNQVNVPIDDHDDCAFYYGDIIVTDNIVCINSAGGKGVCNGDSGGPMNYVVGGVTTTRGITSFVSSSGCESGIPQAFTRVTRYLDWIETNTGIIIDA